LDVSRPISTIDVVTDPSTGAIVGFRELPVDAVQEDLATPDRSMAINRQPGSLEGKLRKRDCLASGARMEDHATIIEAAGES
jgi:hypothetical protein